MAMKRSPIEFGRSPRVNLLPEKQRAEQRHEQTLPKLLLALVASGVVAGLIFVAGTIPVTLANQELAAVEAESQSLNVEIASFGKAQEMLAAVGGRSSDRLVITETEVLFMSLRDQLLAIVPEGSTIVRFAAALPGSEADAAAEPAVAEACAATGSSLDLTLATPGEGGLTAAAAFLERAGMLDGLVCGLVVDNMLLSAGDVAASETQLRLIFDETVRAGRFVEEEAQ
ncbi:hypothetical protein [Leucobacter sp. W1478]|uniref:hypothetical protein n=1 Tax=Leucobacter sp. W1478 TaxID=3439065 RepID=UPI003F2D62C8